MFTLGGGECVRLLELYRQPMPETHGSVPAEILRLVERFAEHRDDYLGGRYNETQLRREFLDPFFKALGWDVDNEQGHAEAYKDVIHEDSIRVEGAAKALASLATQMAALVDQLGGRRDTTRQDNP